jgi:drug/metabolite transporter (DMT)-like permease
MKHNRDQAILHMILASFSFSIMATFVKFSTASLPSMEIVFFRSFLGSILVGGLIAKNRISWIGKKPKISILRGLFGFGALSFHFYAISQLDLGTAVMLNYTAPIFVVILAHLLLKEKTTWVVASTILCSFAGLYLLAAPQFEVRPTAILFGILSGILAAVAYVLIRFTKKIESPYTVIFYFTAISTLGSIPFMIPHFIWPSLRGWIGILGVTVGAFFGQVFLTKSIQGAPVSRVLPLSYLTPVFAATFGMLLWKEFFTVKSLIGGAIIIACGTSLYLLREKPAYVPLEE